MAVDSAELEQLRNNIPEAYRVHAGNNLVLTSGFLSASGHKNPSTESAFSNSGTGHEELSRALVNAVAPDQATSITLSNSQQAARDNQIAITTKRKKGEEAQLMRSTLDILNARLRQLDAQIERIDKRIGEINERRSAIGDQLEALAELEELNANGAFDAKNKNHRDIMKKAGIDPDTSSADLAVVIAEQRKTLGAEDATLEGESNALIKSKDELLRERAEVLEAKANIENATTDEARAAVEERARLLVGLQQLSGVTYQTSGSELRETVTHAILGEASGEQADNNDLAQDALTEQQDTVFDNSAANFSP